MNTIPSHEYVLSTLTPATTGDLLVVAGKKTQLSAANLSGLPQNTRTWRGVLWPGRFCSTESVAMPTTN